MYLLTIASLATLNLVLAGPPSRVCDEMEQRVADADRNTLTLYPPDIQGKWVSDRCESRPGPEYLLRSHQYTDNDTYSAILHKYRDPSCSVPWYSVHTRGRALLKGRSWLAPASTQVEFLPDSVVIVPHSQQGADDLSSMLNISCGGLVWRRWRAHLEYTVVTSRETEDTAFLQTRDWLVGGAECLEPLGLTHAAVSFLRIQVRPPGPPDLTARTELLLGEPALKGTRLQTPLLFLAQAGPGCLVCTAVDRSSIGNPPILPAPTLLHMAGEWVSIRCEPRPTGLFLKRRLRVTGVSWEADYKFFSDPVCKGPTLTVSAEGRMSEESVGRVPGAKDLDFFVTRAWINILDQAMLNGLGRGCGPTGDWKVGVRREVTPSAGCPALGISVPRTEYELVRLELDPSGQALLYLGQSEERKVRPTAFQPPLLQCDAPELPPLTHFLNSMNPASRPAPPPSSLFLTLLLLLRGATNTLIRQHTFPLPTN